jgi:predicted secreted Zn-dependent protease
VNQQRHSKAQDLFELVIQSDPSNYKAIADVQERLTDAREHQQQQQQTSRTPEQKQIA